MTSDIMYLHFKRAIESNKECFLCALEDEIERKYIDTYLYELVMDASSRQKIIESRGFCNHHFYKMLIAASKPGSPDGHGMALVLKSVAEKLIQDLNRNDFQEMLASEIKCPACISSAGFMEAYIEGIVELLSSNHEEFSKLFKESKGLCICHYVTLVHVTKEITRDRSQDIIQTITEVEKKNFKRLSSELAEYVRRQSYEFSEKDRAAVEGIVLRSVEKIAGRRGVKTRNPFERRRK